MRSLIEKELATKLDPKLVSELLDAHAEAKRNYYLGGLRLSAVEGGRFCEAAFRLLEFIAKGGVFTAIGKQLDTDRLIRELGNSPAGQLSDSVRLHIPRSLRLVYDIRNKRDAAHLADGIDPNLQDASLIVSVIDWVLAEFIRLCHSVSADEASKIVSNIVSRTAPVVQDFGGFLKVLNPNLGASGHCLILLYQRGADGASYEDLLKWVRPSMRKNLKRTLGALVHKKDFVHSNGDHYVITRLGEQFVEKYNLISPEQLAK